MRHCFVIEDGIHGEQSGELSTLGEAWSELQRLSLVPWDEHPNKAPCTSWQNCGRKYDILEYEFEGTECRVVKRVPGLEISSRGSLWSSAAPRRGA
jgi:hypothetical protein